MKQLAGWLRIGGLLLVETALVVVLWFAGPVMGTIDWGNLHNWLANSTPAGAVTALLRVLGLVGAGWVLLTSSLWVLAGAAQWRDLQARLGKLTLPPVRRLLQPVAGLSMLASAAMSSGVASAAPAAVSTHLVVADSEPFQQKGSVPEVALPVPIAVSTSAVGRHIPHPGVIDHALPASRVGFVASAVPSPANHFAGLKPGTKVYVVQPGDCLSVIAEKHLGDWRLDLVIDQLNRGRLQPDGRALVDDHWIYPGWVLVMPPDATGTIVVGAEHKPAGDHRPPGRDRRSPPVEHVSSPHWAEPGPIPSTSSDVSSTVPEPKVPTTVPAPVDRRLPVPRHQAPPSSVPGPETVPQRDKAPVRESGADVAPVAGWVGGLAAVVAGGVLWKLDRARRERSHSRPKGHVLVPTRPEVQAAERRLRAIADTERLSWVDAGLRYVTGLMESRAFDGATIPSLTFVEAGPTGLMFMFTGELDETLGWLRRTADRKFSLDPEVDLAELEVLATDRWPAWPVLVSLGEVESGGSLFANLEHFGSVCVEGPEEAASSFVAYLGVQLASMPWADEMLGGVFTLGRAPLGAKARTVPDDAAMDLAERLDGIASSNAKVAGGLSISALRAVAAEALPHVVLAFPGAPGEAVRCLAEAAQPETSALVCVTAESCHDAAWRVVIDSQGNAVLQATTDGQGESVKFKVPCSGREVTLVDEAIRATGSTVPFTPSESQEREDTTIDIRAEATGVAASSGLDPSTEGPVPRTKEDDQGPHAVEIAVLGPVELHGGDLEAVEPGRQTAALSLIAYLATREHMVTAEELATTLWPLDASKDTGNGPQRKTVMNVVSRARALLGYGRGGSERIIYSQRGYRLSPDVTSDWARFQRLITRARRSSASERTALLKQALDLVRGEPFTGALSSQFFEWVASEHLDFTISAQVVDVAQELGELALEAGDMETVKLAVDKGLQIEPTREELFRLWMHLLGRTGRPARVDDVYKRLLFVLRQRVHPLQEPQPESRAVWRQYTAVEFATNVFD